MPVKDIAQFTVQHVQVMDEEGNVDESLMPDLSDDQIKNLYETMVLMRTFDDKAFNMQRQGRIGTYIQFKGQEASQLGTAFALEDDDFMFPMYRSAGALIARKHPMEMILKYEGGDEAGVKNPEKVKNFPIAIAVGTQMPHATGAAWASRLKGDKRVAMVYFGDGASSKADFHEGLNFAGVFNAPAIYVCENNQFAISVPRNKQCHAETIAQKAIGYGVHGVQVDGNDIFGVIRVAQEAVKRGREENKPTLIETLMYRLADHSTSDDAKRYRTDEELSEWEKKGPIVRFEKFLEKKGILTPEYKEQVYNQAKEKVDTAIEAYENAPAPDREELFKYVYAEPNPFAKAYFDSQKDL